MARCMLTSTHRLLRPQKACRRLGDAPDRVLKYVCQARGADGEGSSEGRGKEGLHEAKNSGDGIKKNLGSLN